MGLLMRLNFTLHSFSPSQKQSLINMFGNTVRHFSTSPAVKQLVKPPIQLYSLEGRYASALYSAAHKQKALQQVEKDLQTFDGLLNKDKTLREPLLNPVISKSLKKDAISSVLSKSKASPLSINLFSAMAENGRLKMSAQVAKSFATIMQAVRGEVECEVTTAKALTDAELKEVQATLGGFLKKGETIKISTKVDPSIIGGMLVSIGDKFVDMSIATKITKYTELINQRV